MVDMNMVMSKIVGLGPEKSGRVARALLDGIAVSPELTLSTIQAIQDPKKLDKMIALVLGDDKVVEEIKLKHARELVRHVTRLDHVIVHGPETDQDVSLVKAAVTFAMAMAMEIVDKA
jgi:nicotinic acid mononucleotide adenylyltransferase